MGASKEDASAFPPGSWLSLLKQQGESLDTILQNVEASGEVFCDPLFPAGAQASASASAYPRLLYFFQAHVSHMALNRH